MYHPIVEALALTLVEVPFTLATIILFTIIIYFIMGLQQSAAQFLYVFLFFLDIDRKQTESSLTVDFFFSIYFLFILVVTLSMKAFFRGLAAAFKGEGSGACSGSSWGVASSIISLHRLSDP